AGPTAHTVVATGLDNPRGLEVGPGGSVFVAEAGAGGEQLVEGLVEGQPSFLCVGLTGGVTAVIGDVQVRLVNLASASAAAGEGSARHCESTGRNATGPHDVALGNGSIGVTIGLGGTPETRQAMPAALRAQFGTVRMLRSRGTAVVADLVAYEGAANPIGPVDSNPYGIARLSDGGFLVADAGGNDLVHVGGPSRSGTPTVTTLTIFPNRPAQPFVPPSCVGTTVPAAAFPPAGTPMAPETVPTTVEVGSNGTFYVGMLTGFPFHQGAASILRVSPTGRQNTFASGLTHVVGLDIARDGSLYAVELSTASLLQAACGGPVPGDVVQFRNGRRTVVAAGLPAPGGVAVAPDGSFYVSVNSTSPGEGEVWRFAAPRG
ncbi:MAG: Gluconolactonase, partial [Frankiales bacterium]|nr:Gluconolactonase [Frankiales bacterium]